MRFAVISKWLVPSDVQPEVNLFEQNSYGHPNSSSNVAAS